MTGARRKGSVGGKRAHRKRRTKIVPTSVVPTKARTLTPDEVNELLKDWFVDRDDVTYTKITAAQKLAWEPTDNSAYSSFLLGAEIKTDTVIRKAYRIARSMVTAMNIPGRVQLCLSKDDNCTDGRTIWVGTKVFDDKELPMGERVDVFIGIAVHETLHILQTDFKLKPDELKWQEYERKIIHDLTNIIEDERIEMWAGEHKPGTVRFLEKMKYWVFDKAHVEIEKQKEKDRQTRAKKGLPEPPPNLFEQAITTLLYIIRYPRYLKAGDIDVFGARFSDIREVLTPYPESTLEASHSAEQIYIILRDLITDEFKESMQQKEEVEKAIREAMEALGQLLKHIVMVAANDEGTGQPVAGTRGIEVSAEMDEVTPSLVIGDVTEGEQGGTYYHKVEPNYKEYKDSMSRVGRYVAALRKSLKYNSKNIKVVHTSMRSGTLDTNKLVEASMGVPTVYKLPGEVKTDTVAVCFLIDMSGSMSISDDEGVSSAEAARDTAIAMYEALKGNPHIQLYIYGHTADTLDSEGDTALFTFYEHGAKKSKHALGAVRAIANNRDGVAILEIAKRVRKQTHRKCLMFVLSDGYPNARGYYDGVHDTKMKVKQVEKMGFDVVQIAINHHTDPKEMFSHHVVLDDLQKLPKGLNLLLKRTLLRNQKITVT